MPCSLWDLNSPTRDWTQALAVKALSSDHWTTREFPDSLSFVPGTCWTILFWKLMSFSSVLKVFFYHFFVNLCCFSLVLCVWKLLHFCLFFCCCRNFIYFRLLILLHTLKNFCSHAFHFQSPFVLLIKSRIVLAAQIQCLLSSFEDTNYIF